MLKLPFAISIPHGGTEVPSAFKPYVIASSEDLKEDTDHLTREIFGLSEEQVECTMTFPYGRTFVDLNRAPTAYGDGHPDGVVKQKTHTGRPVFETFPPKETVVAVLEELYNPYHQKLSSLVNSHRVQLLIDCHSMAPKGLAGSPDSMDQERPLVCLGHRGGVTAPLELVQAFQHSLCQAYGLSPQDISIDRPFSGGYITQTYGPGPIPVIQIEFNRKMYLKAQEGLAEPRLAEQELSSWRERFYLSLQTLYRTSFLSSAENAEEGAPANRSSH